MAKSTVIDVSVPETKLHYFRSPLRKPVKKSFSLPSRTHRSFGAAADINYVVNRYIKSGTPIPQDTSAYYADVADAQEKFDYQTIQNTIIEADRAFMTLPATIRERFQNDPPQLLQFLENPNNRSEAERLGIIPEKQPQTAVQAGATGAEQGVPLQPDTVGSQGPK